MPSGLDGVADATAKLQELGAKTTARELRATVKGALEIVEHKARARMPTGSEPHKTYKGRLVSPGYALSTLHIEMSLNKERGAVYGRLGVSREAFYATQFVEVGTSKTPAQPWLRPSFEESETQMVDHIGSEVKARAEKIARRRARSDRKNISLYRG